MKDERLVSYHSPIKRISDGKLFVYFLDMEQPFSLWRRVVCEFIEKFEGTKAELLLRLEPLNPEAFRYGEELLEMLANYKERDCFVNIYSEILDNDLILLGKADHYITNRHPLNIRRMCTAERIGVICISGVNREIFSDV